MINPRISLLPLYTDVIVDSWKGHMTVHMYMGAVASYSAESSVTTILCSRCVRTTYCWWMSSIACLNRGLESTGGVSRRRRHRWWMEFPWWRSVPSQVQLRSSTNFGPREQEHTCGTLMQVHAAHCACHVVMFPFVTCSGASSSYGLRKLLERTCTVAAGTVHVSFWPLSVAMHNGTRWRRGRLHGVCACVRTRVCVGEGYDKVSDTVRHLISLHYAPAITAAFFLAINLLASMRNLEASSEHPAHKFDRGKRKCR
jgi:hypothetical protein